MNYCEKALSEAFGVVDKKRVGFQRRRRFCRAIRHHICPWNEGTLPRSCGMDSEGLFVSTTARKCAPTPRMRHPRILVVRVEQHARARERAARDLGEMLHMLIANAPTARHFVLAHSHGGTVALHAILGTELENDIDGVVCMATPFLHVHRNSNDDFGKTLGILLGWAMPVCAVVGFAVWALTWPFFRAHDFVAATGRAVLLSSALVSIGFIFRALTRATAKRLFWAADRMCEWNAWPPQGSPRKKVLVLRSDADEASGVLAAMHFATWLVRKAAWIASLPGSLSMRALEWVDLSREWVKGLLRGGPGGSQDIEDFVGSSPLLIFLAYLFSCGLFLLDMSLAVLLVLAIIFSWAVKPLMALVALPFVLAAATSSLVFGRDVPPVSPLLDISAEWTPPGSWMVFLLSSGGDRKGLRHSVYDDPRATRHIAEWMCDLERNGPT